MGSRPLVPGIPDHRFQAIESPESSGFFVETRLGICLASHARARVGIHSVDIRTNLFHPDPEWSPERK